MITILERKTIFRFQDMLQVHIGIHAVHPQLCPIFERNNAINLRTIQVGCNLQVSGYSNEISKAFFWF